LFRLGSLVRIVTLFALGSAVIGAASSAYAGDAPSAPRALPPAERRSNQPPKVLDGPEIRPRPPILNPW
jgi:hypothetical protein